MVFSSPFFVFLFLPVFLGAYFLVPARARTGWILVGSWVFYACWRLDFLVLVAAVTFGNWLAGAVVSRLKPDRPAAARAAIVVAVAANLGVLAYFKYFNFGVDSWNALSGLWGARPLAAWKVILPVGISFYVFQAMSYVVDVYRGDAPPASGFVELAAYIALFPQFVAGPILRYKDVVFQLRGREYEPAGVAYGVRRFVIGFCRKVLIADSVAPLANAAFSLASPTAADAWLGVAAYAVQLYFDFSGYSDMAVGLGHMMGFTFMENFDAPYRSASVTEFWRRWHISLSTWLRDYLYVPLGGNRKGTARTYLNLAIVMTLGGLWHGASWNFVLWGAWHGAWLCLERALGVGKARPGNAAARAFRRALTLAVVLVGWVLFRAPDVSGALTVLAAMSGASGLAPSADMLWRSGGLELAMLAAGMAVIVLEPRAAKASLVARNDDAAPSPLRLHATRAALVALGVAAVLKLSADSFSPFLYFQF